MVSEKATVMTGEISIFKIYNFFKISKKYDWGQIKINCYWRDSNRTIPLSTSYILYFLLLPRFPSMRTLQLDVMVATSGI